MLRNDWAFNRRNDVFNGDYKKVGYGGDILRPEKLSKTIFKENEPLLRSNPQVDSSEKILTKVKSLFTCSKVWQSPRDYEQENYRENGCENKLSTFRMTKQVKYDYSDNSFNSNNLYYTENSSNSNICKSEESVAENTELYRQEYMKYDENEDRSDVPTKNNFRVRNYIFQQPSLTQKLNALQLEVDEEEEESKVLKAQQPRTKKRKSKIDNSSSTKPKPKINLLKNEPKFAPSAGSMLAENLAKLRYRANFYRNVYQKPNFYEDSQKPIAYAPKITYVYHPQRFDLNCDNSPVESRMLPMNFPLPNYNNYNNYNLGYYQKPRGGEYYHPSYSYSVQQMRYNTMYNYTAINQGTVLEQQVVSAPENYTAAETEIVDDTFEENHSSTACQPKRSTFKTISMLDMVDTAINYYEGLDERKVKKPSFPATAQLPQQYYYPPPEYYKQFNSQDCINRNKSFRNYNDPSYNFYYDSDVNITPTPVYEAIDSYHKQLNNDSMLSPSKLIKFKSKQMRLNRKGNLKDNQLVHVYETTEFVSSTKTILTEKTTSTNNLCKKKTKGKKTKKLEKVDSKNNKKHKFVATKLGKSKK